MKLEWIAGEDGQLDAAIVLQARTGGTADAIAMMLQYRLAGSQGPSVEQFLMPLDLARMIGRGLLDAADQVEKFQQSRN